MEGVVGLEETLEDEEGTLSLDDGMGEWDLDPWATPREDDEPEGSGEWDRDVEEKLDDVGVAVPLRGRFNDDRGTVLGGLEAEGLGGPASLFDLPCLEPGFKKWTAKFKADLVMATCVGGGCGRRERRCGGACWLWLIDCPSSSSSGVSDPPSANSSSWTG